MPRGVTPAVSAVRGSIRAMTTPPPPDSPFEVLSVEELRARSSLKWSRYDPDVLPLWVAEMDVLPAPEVVEAIVSAARSGDLGYPGQGEFAYAEALAEFAAARWGWEVDVARSVTCADAMSGIGAVLTTAMPPAAPVVIPSPVYPPFALFSSATGRRVVRVGLTDTGRLDLPAIGAALGAEPSFLLLCNPHNPTGAVHTADELRELAGIAERTGSTVISDEVHGPLVHSSATFVPWLTVSDHGFAITSAAKSFNLAGLKAAVILAGAEEGKRLAGLPPATRYGASSLGVIAHAAAYRSAPGWLDAVNTAIAANVARLGERLAGALPEIGLTPPEATYLAWLDCTRLGLGNDPAEAFLRVGRVGLNSGPPFGPGGRGHARINVACSAAVLDEAIERMAATVAAGREGRA